MIERGYGRIINVASLAGLVPAPAGHTLYGAVKAFVIRFSEALAQEVAAARRARDRDLPGLHAERVSRRDRARAASVSKMPSWMWMDAPTVARQGFDAVMAGTPLYVNGRVNRTIAALAGYLPLAVVEAVGRRAAKGYRKS